MADYNGQYTGPEIDAGIGIIYENASKLGNVPANTNEELFKKADKNGYYPQLHAGVADELPKDLSYCDINGLPSITMNTANCYVIKGNGSFRIPLVYGNGIKGGTVNAPAYTKITGANTADFVNHLGNVITTPYIEAMPGCRAASAALIWSEVDNCISDVRIIGAGLRYLAFEVKNFPATGANAIVGIFDTLGNCIWSWHLWMFPDALDPLVFTNHTEVDYTLLPYNLGWTWDDTSKAHGKNPHYQWGRKDPMVSPAAYNSTTSHATFGTKTFGLFGTDGDQSADKTVANAVAKPWLFFTRYDSTSSNWNNLTRFNNFWNAAKNADDLADDQATAIKTIYDPCPAGYMLPSGRAFTGFTSTGNNSEDATTFRVVGAFANGWKFKKNVDDVVGSHFPASGFRDSASGGLSSGGSRGYYWSYASYSQALARYLYFNAGGVYPLYNGSRAYGFSVRPCKELI